MKNLSHHSILIDLFLKEFNTYVGDINAKIEACFVYKWSKLNF